MKRNKQGISLIVLVLTIIIMIILAAAVIVTLSNSNIIDRADEAVSKTDVAQLQQLASIAWAEAYARAVEDGTQISAESLKDDVIKSLEDNGYSEATLNNYNIDVTTEGVTVSNNNSGGSNPNVTATVNGVPIPKGFVASPYAGENTKAGGLVIYELKGDETAIPDTEDQYTSWTTRNQFVWIPVDNFSEFVRRDFTAAASKPTSNILGEMNTYWELELDENNMPKTKENISDFIADGKLDYITETTINESIEMYKSVKQYGGFYIGRYEAGLDDLRTQKGDLKDLPKGSSVHVKMGKAPYVYIPWTENDVLNEDTNGAVEVARSMYPNNETNKTGVISTLTYEVQDDTMLKWTNAIATTSSLRSSYSVGDFNKGAKYYDNNLSNVTTNIEYDENGNSTTTSVNGKILTCGAVKKDNFKNIYDIVESLFEWTMQGGTNSSQSKRIVRGNSWDVWCGAEYDELFPSATNGCGIGGGRPEMYGSTVGFRPSLYIKVN